MASEQNSSRTHVTASVMLYGTERENFTLLFTTTLPRRKFRISSFLKPKVLSRDLYSDDVLLKRSREKSMLVTRRLKNTTSSLPLLAVVMEGVVRYFTGGRAVVGALFSSIMTTAGSGSAPSKSPESEVGLGSDTSVAGGEGKESETGVSVTLTSLSGDIESSSLPSDVSLRVNILLNVRLIDDGFIFL
ncbi:hypothetical protein F7725_020041 [Dissostichus mawsoni]|uniref:Uncharacterized protein n=1 Tax=Dissostichus mawsoni TaxID=36200 RepID=A0A7J5YLF2_DISMA|nr:hypothetical protein F7725_020041 [Dissostichus mawsoni]